MSEQVGNKQIIQGEDIVVTVDGKPTLHATNHSLKVDLEVKDIRTKDTNGKEKYPGDISWSVDVEGLVVIDPDLAATRDNAEDILQSILMENGDKRSLNFFCFSHIIPYVKILDVQSY